MVRIPAVAEQIPVASMNSGRSWRNWLLAAVSFVIALAAAEYALRLAGRTPGEFRRLDGFHTVDNLVVYENYATDESGIYRFSPWVTDSMHMLFSGGAAGFRNILGPEYAFDRVRTSLDGVTNVHEEFRALHAHRSPSWIIRFLNRGEVDDQSEFVRGLRRTEEKGGTPFGKILRQYAERPFNKDGFRSIPFTRIPSDAPHVLVIGDSFALECLQNLTTTASPTYCWRAAIWCIVPASRAPTLHSTRP